MYPKIVESLSVPTEPGYELLWSGDAVRAGGVWFAGPATYVADSAPRNALDPPTTGNAIQTDAGGEAYSGAATGNWFWVEFPRVPPVDAVIEFSITRISGVIEGYYNMPRVWCAFDGPWGVEASSEGQWLDPAVEIGPESWLISYLVANPAHSNRLRVGAGIGRIHHITKIETATPPLGGAWRLRQRQTLTGSDSWPLRQRQNGGHSGSWPLRQRQRGV